MQKKGLYQVKHIPKYTTNGYKKMEIPTRLYELILEIRKTADFKSETCDGNYLINCHRIKENGKKGTYSMFLWVKSFTSLMADLSQDINRVFSFIRCLNRTFP